MSEAFGFRPIEQADCQLEIQMEMSEKLERLSAMVNEARQHLINVAEAAESMPEWFVQLTMTIDDRVSRDARHAIIRQYALLVGQWHTLDSKAWDRVRCASLLAIVREAKMHCPENEVQVHRAIDNVLAWLGADAPDYGRTSQLVEIEQAMDFAVSASAEWALKAAVHAVNGDATEAAWAAARAAFEAANAAVWEWTANMAGSYARAEEEAVEASAEAWEMTWDRISQCVLAALEEELTIA